MKKEFPLLSTESGQIGWAVSLWFLLFLGILLICSLQTEVYRSAAVRLEDTLAASNLAAAVIDLEEYGTTHEVLIRDPEEAFARYQEAVKGNLGLNEAWENSEIEWLQGPVKVERFLVYNVTKQGTFVYEMNGAGKMGTGAKRTGVVTAPNGKMVEHTGIYSELSFQTSGLFDLSIKGHKGILVDVARKEEEIQNAETE